MTIMPWLHAQANDLYENNQQVLLKWQFKNDADLYEVEISKNKHFSTIETKKITPEDRLYWRPKSQGLYYWRVRARDTLLQEWSDYSVEGSIEVTPKPIELTTPEEIFVNDDKQKQLVNFQWSSSALITSYELEIRSDQERYKYQTQKTSYPLQLLPGKYQWRITSKQNNEITSTKWRPLSLVLEPSILKARENERRQKREQEEANSRKQKIKKKENLNLQKKQKDLMKEQKGKKSKNAVEQRSGSSYFKIGIGASASSINQSSRSDSLASASGDANNPAASFELLTLLGKVPFLTEAIFSKGKMEISNKKTDFTYQQFGIHAFYDSFIPVLPDRMELGSGVTFLPNVGIESTTAGDIKFKSDLKPFITHHIAYNFKTMPTLKVGVFLGGEVSSYIDSFFLAPYISLRRPLQGQHSLGVELKMIQLENPIKSQNSSSNEGSVQNRNIFLLLNYQFNF